MEQCYRMVLVCPQGRLMFTMLSAVAEFENALRAERQAEGIQKAKKNGVKFGIKSSLTNEQISQIKIEFRSNKVNRKILAEKYGISRASIYRLCS
jgi:DNA invertase Pin-like site-specific DNA recombinase